MLENYWATHTHTHSHTPFLEVPCGVGCIHVCFTLWQSRQVLSIEYVATSSAAAAHYGDVDAGQPSWFTATSCFSAYMLMKEWGVRTIKIIITRSISNQFSHRLIHYKCQTCSYDTGYLKYKLLHAATLSWGDSNSNGFQTSHLFVSLNRYMKFILGRP